ncbi:MAG: hypothetical protein ACUVUC_00395 [Thermoguttaceae bacterium]
MGIGPGAYPGQSPGQAPYRPLDPDTIKAIIHALAVNGSKTARQTLMEVLEGTFKTDDDRAATEGVLETLVLMPSPQNETLLLRVLTNPEQVRPTPKDQSRQGTSSPMGPQGYPGLSSPSGMPSFSTPGPTGMPGSPPPGYPSGYPGMSGSPYSGYSRPGAGNLTAAEMQRKALELVDQHGSEGFRVKLASHLLAPTTSAESRQLLLASLCTPHPRNLAAQTVLYRSEALDKGSKALLESYFIKYSSTVLALLLKLPEPQSAGGTGGGTRGVYGPQPGPGGPLNQPFGPGMPGMPGGTMPGMPGNPARPAVPAPNMPGPRPVRPDSDDESDLSPPRGGLALLAPDDRQPGMPGPPGMPPGIRMPPMPGPGPGMPIGMPGMGVTPGAPMAGAGYRQSGPLEGMPGFSREAIYGLAAPLWSSEFAKAIEGQLGAVESLELDAGTLVLASTIPTDAVRARLLDSLQRHFIDGPQALEAAGFAGEVLSDPGLLVLLKLLPRKESKATQPRPLGLSRLRNRRYGQMGYGENQPGGMYAAGPQGQPGQFPQQRDQTPEAAWTDVCERLVRTMCDRMVIAGKATRGSPSVAEARPITLPRDVQIFSEYHLEWPDDLAEKDRLAGVPLDPMTIHYVRYQGKSTLNKVTSYYRRKLSRPMEHTIATGTWLESLDTVPDSGRKLSVDVLISRAEDLGRASALARGTSGSPYGMMPGQLGGPPGMAAGGPGMYPGRDDSRYGGRMSGPDRQRNETADIVVEILCVEINDPAGAT